ncbi:hypothetical protein GCM10025863_21030 [Microbacterium suwonense]|uniref:Uncharacterized protein n=1 Tax=Microbacterium suwonense TaxID=683047 RepID=A0ABN6X4J8_9MICO|nr:hypothetical protein GCM10025863_21030 [Microbacterium suwonense]
MEETRELYGREDIDIFPAQLLWRTVWESAKHDAVALRLATPKAAWPML